MAHGKGITLEKLNGIINQRLKAQNTNTPQATENYTAEEIALIKKALERECISLHEAVWGSPSLYFDVMRFANENNRCAELCPGADKCNSKGWTPTLDELGRLSYRKCKRAAKHWEIFQDNNRVQGAKIPELYKTMTFSSYRMGYNKTAVEYARQIAEGTEKRGMFLSGGPGTGKTHIAVAVLQHRLTTKNEAGRFYTTPELMRELRLTMNNDKDNAQLLDTLLKIPLLVLDDLGAEKMSDWVAEQLFILINGRYIDQKQTIITSNYNLEELEARMDVQGMRICSRIAGMCKAFELTGEDMRLEI